MRAMPPIPIDVSSGANTDTLANWIEDYVMNEVTSCFPAKVFGVNAERREDYYAVHVVVPQQDMMAPVGELCEKIRQALDLKGINVAIYTYLRNGGR